MTLPIEDYIRGNERKTAVFVSDRITVLGDGHQNWSLLSNTSIEVCLSIYLVLSLEERKERTNKHHSSSFSRGIVGITAVKTC